MQQYISIYVLIGKPRVNTEENVKKLRSDVDLMFQSSTAAIKRLDKEYDDKALRRLNSDTLVLTAYEKAFPLENKYGEQIKRGIEQKIREDNKRVEELTKNTQETVRSCKLKEEDLKSKERDDIAKATTKLEDVSKAKVATITSDFDKLINAASTAPEKEPIEKNKTAALDAERSDLKAKLDDEKNKIKKEYNKKQETLDLECKKKVEELGTEITRFKQIEVGLQVAKEQC